MNCGRKKMKKGGEVSDEFENSKRARDSMNEKRKSDEATLNRGNRGPTTRRRANRMPEYSDGGDVKKKLSEMTDEERYGKVGAEIRRLDPEAYKKRSRTAEGNIALLKELRARAKGGEKAEPEAPKATRVEAAQESMRTGKPIADSNVTSRRRPSAPASSAPASSAPASSVPAPVSRGSRPVPKGRGNRTSSNTGLTRREARIAAGQESIYDSGSFKLRGTQATRERARREGYDGKPMSDPAALARIERARRALGRDSDSPKAPKRAYKKGVMYNSGGSIKKYAAGGAVTRGDGISRVKTRCRMR